MPTEELKKISSGSTSMGKLPREGFVLVRVESEARSTPNQRKKGGEKIISKRGGVIKKTNQVFPSRKSPGKYDMVPDAK